MARSVGEGRRGPAPDVRAPVVPALSPTQLHRAMALLAAMSLFIGTRSLWTQALLDTPLLAVVISAAYAVILAAVVGALVAPTVVSLGRAEAILLAVGIVLVLCALAVHHGPTDEGLLVVQAGRSILTGQPIYGVPWPQVFAAGVPVTHTMAGGADFTFGYPPLAPLLTAAGLLFLDRPGVSSAVTTVALIIGAVVLWWLLPIRFRSAATALMLGFPFLPMYARLGYPAIIAMVLLIPVVVRWPSIGAGGRLGRGDVIRAVCLGAACATQQLAWFVTPFLLVGILMVRRGELPTRAALALVGRFAVIALLTFVVIDLPFLVRDPAAWAAGVLLVLTQHAVPHGQGLIDVSFYLTDGSGALDLYADAALLLGAALLVASALWMRRLGPAITVLPWFVFYLSVRSQDGYFLLMTPLWLAAAATVPPTAVAGAWQPRLPSIPLLSQRLLRPTLLALLFVPAVAAAAIAVTSDEPLELDVTHVAAHSAKDHGLYAVDVHVVNTSAVALVPHFTISTGQGTSAFWDVVTGPTTLAPHAGADYTLRASTAAGYDPGKHGFLFLRALTDHPMTVSTARIPITP